MKCLGAIVALMVSLGAAPSAFAAEAFNGFAQTLKDLQGKNFKLESITHPNHLVIMFWGTWCDICKAKMKTVLSDVQNKHEAEVITIGLDKDPDRVAYAVQKEKIPFPVFIDPEKKLIKELKVFGAPHWAVYKKSEAGTWTLVDTASGFEDNDFFAALKK